MKKVLAPLLALALFGAVHAQATDSTLTTTTANPIDLIEAPATAALTLAVPEAGATATSYDSPAAQSGTLSVSHNRGGALTKKVSLSATAGANADNDITLKVGQSAVDATAASNYVTVVNAGVLVTDNAAGALDLIIGIADGSSTYDLWWDADATIANTGAGAYEFTVTFTTADE